MFGYSLSTQFISHNRYTSTLVRVVVDDVRRMSLEATRCLQPGAGDFEEH